MKKKPHEEGKIDSLLDAFFTEKRREEMNQVKELLRDRLLRMGLISNSKKAHEHALELLAEDIVKFYE